VLRLDRGVGGEDAPHRRDPLASTHGAPLLASLWQAGLRCQLDKAEITLRLVLPRAALERLTARAIQEQRKIEALVQEILEGTVAERGRHSV
jgi:hypothetical protein